VVNKGVQELPIPRWISDAIVNDTITTQINLKGITHIDTRILRFYVAHEEAFPLTLCQLSDVTDQPTVSSTRLYIVETIRQVVNQRLYSFDGSKVSVPFSSYIV